jgi:hypothetical protein
MDARTLIAVASLFALSTVPAWAIGCVIEPSPVDCTVGRTYGYHPISPPPPVYYSPPIYSPPVRNYYPNLPSYAPTPTTRCILRDTGDGRGSVVTCQ